MIKKVLAAILLIGAISASCKNAEDDGPLTPVIPSKTQSLIPQSQGNYWVYQRYSADSVGNIVQIMSAVDSLFVIKDTLNGDSILKFQVYNGTPNQMRPTYLGFYPLSMLSDSGSFYIVDQGGNKYPVSNASLPVTLPESFLRNVDDTLAREVVTIQKVSNPMPEMTANAVMLEIVYPIGYLVRQKITNRNIWIKGVGLYQFELSAALKPYPNMGWRLLRHKVS